MSVSPWQESEPLSEINITPFVDVLLVLLIIFMVTAPIINHVVQVDLPKDAYDKDKIKPLQEPLRVVIDKEGILYLGDKKIGETHLERSQAIFQKDIQKWVRSQPEPWFVDVEADEKTRYGDLVPVIARLKEMNVGLNLLIEPLPK